jgi:hypothetical protein
VAFPTGINNRRATIFHEGNVLTATLEKFIGFLVLGCGILTYPGINVFSSDRSEGSRLPWVKDCLVMTTIDTLFNSDKCLIVFLVNHVIVRSILPGGNGQG